MTAVSGPASAVRWWWRGHPRAGLAFRTAIAGGLAWWVAQLLPGAEAGRYAYFAPMGAVIVTSTSVAGTVRELLRSLGAVILGTALGLAAIALTPPNALSIAVVIAVSVLAAGWARLGTMRGWVPTVAIFTLVLGGGQPWAYATAYIGLSGLGAAIGAAVVAAIPQLVLQPLDVATRHLWSMTIERLQQVKHDLESEATVEVVSSADFEAAIWRLSDQLDDAKDAGRINRRSRRADLRHRLAYARSILTMAQRLEAFERRLVEHQSDGMTSVDGDLGRVLGETVELILQAIQKHSNDDLDAGLDDVLARLDEVVHRVPDGTPGLHTASASALELRQLALATRDAVDEGRRWM